MVDFDRLVLSPASDIFSIKCRFTPLVSSPGDPAFDLRGVYSSGPVDVQMQDETIFSDQQTSLGVRFRDFPVRPPERGDLVEITDAMHPHVGRKFWIGDVDEDGQGGGLLLLRTYNPEPVEDTGP
ncbi:MAG TPA: hypothetical protein VGR63_19230 [Casimicrobiaceae bacterium]|jgi:hypothetical protein|nr:hypothetical protein [Casimicrobiaceae bacterium]